MYKSTAPNKVLLFMVPVFLILFFVDSVSAISVFYSLNTDDLQAEATFNHSMYPAEHAVDGLYPMDWGWWNEVDNTPASLLIKFVDGLKPVNKIQIISGSNYAGIFELSYTTDLTPGFGSTFSPLTELSFLDVYSGSITNNHVDMDANYDEILIEFEPVYATGIKFYNIEAMQHGTIIREITIDEYIPPIIIPEPSSFILLGMSLSMVYLRKKFTK